MLKKSLVLIVLVSIYSKAQTIENIVQNVLAKNYSLKAIQSSIDSLKEDIKLSSKWDNPVLSFGATDVQFEETFSRDKEAMQAQFIGITQNIPIGDKLKIQEEIATDELEISQYELKDKRLQLKSNIYEFAYNIKLLEERLRLIDEFKSNNKKLHSLLNELYKYGKSTKMQILENELALKELNLNSLKINTLLETMKLKLQELNYEKIENIEFKTDINPITLDINIEKHPKILQIEQRKEKLLKVSDLEKEKKYSDLKMNLTYFQRDEKFNDYVNISFAIPLSLNGAEDIKSVKAKYKSMQENQILSDSKIKFSTQIKNLQQSIDDSITTFRFIENEIIPKYYEVQKVLENYNSHMLYKNFDTKALINNENEIIKYKLKAIDEKEKYFNSLAKLEYFKQDL